LYQQIQQSPIAITEVDWRDPNNLILQTELGTVHFGLYGANFGTQLQALDRLRNLPEHPQFKKMDYIDLRDPNSPYLHLTPQKPPSSPKKPET
jgi:cell division protein FtsQ